MGSWVVSRPTAVLALSVVLAWLSGCTEGTSVSPPPTSVGLSGSSTGSGSTAGPATTPDPDGCPPSVPGCPCLFDACDAGLVCVEGMCEAPFDATTSGGSTSEAQEDTAHEGSTGGDTDESTGATVEETSSTGPGEGDETTTGAPAVDPCGSAFAGPGHYCGMSIGGESNVLYECNAAGQTVAQYVGPGCPVCVVCPAGFADYCEGGFVPPASCQP